MRIPQTLLTLLEFGDIRAIIYTGDGLHLKSAYFKTRINLVGEVYNKQMYILYITRSDNYTISM